jgi:methionyl-tRNA formyltransferase
MTKYVIASSKDWFKKHIKSSEYANLNLIEISTREELNLEFLEKINPRYIFFPHWNWKVNAEIYQRFECIAFHTAPLPFGRGGSPIQNLILKGIKYAPVCALRMTNILDGGPIYDSINISLEGNITEIFSRIATCVEKIILKICKDTIIPIDQSGEIFYFKRLTHNDNELKDNYSIHELYDRIRMVDGLDYPRAFINFGQYRLELTKACLKNGRLTAEIEIKSIIDAKELNP